MSTANETGIWPDVKVKTLGGVPTLTRDGKAWFGWGANRPFYPDHFEVYERLAKEGLRHFHCDATCTEDMYHPELRFWKAPGQYDGAAQDAQFSRLKAICDDALLQLKIGVYAPDWWLDANPGHCQVYADGSVLRALQRAGVRKAPSLASPLWREEACRAMWHYVKWLIETGWSRRVFAMNVCTGITWEWALLGSDGYLDYCDHAQRYFNDYLQRKYGDGRKAEIPAPERRAMAGGYSGVRPSPEYQDVIDHQQSLSEMNVDFLLDLAAAAKQASGRQVLIGAFYGYTLTAREQTPFTGQYGAGGFVGGHHALGRLLRSADVDMLGCPFNYANRDLGTGLLYEHTPLASVHAHGKAFSDENDLYAYNNPQETDDRAASISVGFTSTFEETIQAFRVAFAQAIVRGKHQWLTELTGWIGKFQENFSDPGLLADIRRLNLAADGLLAMDRTPVAELAFVLDEKSIAHLTLDNKQFVQEAYKASVWWGHTGAPFDLILLDDLLEQRRSPYRMIVPVCLAAPGALDSANQWASAQGIHVGAAPDPAALLAAMSTCGIHRYVCDSSTVWANRSMVFIHVNDAGPRTIFFRSPCRGYDLFSERTFAAENGSCTWEFAQKDSALLICDESAYG